MHMKGLLASVAFAAIVAALVVRLNNTATPGGTVAKLLGKG